MDIAQARCSCRCFEGSIVLQKRNGVEGCLKRLLNVGATTPSVYTCWTRSSACRTATRWWLRPQTLPTSTWLTSSPVTRGATTKSVCSAAPSSVCSTSRVGAVTLLKFWRRWASSTRGSSSIRPRWSTRVSCTAAIPSVSMLVICVSLTSSATATTTSPASRGWNTSK